MSEDTVRGAAQRRSTWDAMAVFLQRRALVMLALGFAAGMPNLLIYDTLSVWLRQAKVPLDVITLLSLVTITYALKFLWAPVVDRVRVPGLHQMLGKRRAWMLLTQAGVVIGIWAISINAPAVSAAVAGEAAGAVQPDPNLALIGILAACAAMTAFFGATQDIAIDAWRIEAAAVEDQGVMAAAYQWGYRIAIVVSGAVPLWLASRIGWSASYGLMALVMAVGMIGVLLAPRGREQETPAAPPTRGPAGLEALEWGGRLAVLLIGAAIAGAGLSGRAEPLTFLLTPFGVDGASLSAVWTARPLGAVWQVLGVLAGLAIIAAATYPLPGARSRPSAYFAATLKEPLQDFFVRYRGGATLILAMICVYRISDFVLNLMGPFYVDVGFTTDDIANARKLFGIVMSVLGVGLGGWSVARFGLLRPMLVGAVLQPVSNIVFASLTVTGPWLPGLYFCIAIDNISAGIAGTCLIAYMSSLTSLGFTATQYALFSSLYALPGKLLGAISGRIVEGATEAAAGGGFQWMRGWFSGMSPDAFARLAAERGLPAEAFAIGYVSFFLYTGVVGVAGVALAYLIMRRGANAQAQEKAPA
ncbi:MAG: MFS transporter [Hydrogenophilaceae bacterium]|nr:MFS transporter [Hydrogenophilaceae bacterium]